MLHPTPGGYAESAGLRGVVPYIPSNNNRGGVYERQNALSRQAYLNIPVNYSNFKDLRESDTETVASTAGTINPKKTRKKLT